MTYWLGVYFLPEVPIPTDQWRDFRPEEFDRVPELAVRQRCAEEPVPLINTARVTYYKNLISAIDNLLKKWTETKRQFNSRLELDNALVAQLPTFEQ